MYGVHHTDDTFCFLKTFGSLGLCHLYGLISLSPLPIMVCDMRGAWRVGFVEQVRCFDFILRTMGSLEELSCFVYGRGIWGEG